MSAQFLPATPTAVESAGADQPAPVPSARAVKPASPRQPASVAGTIEIKFGGATVRIDGQVDESMLAAVLSHFHP